MAKKTNKYIVNRKSVGLRLMWEKEGIVLHNGLSQKKLKELYEAGFTNLITVNENVNNDNIASA